MMTTLALLLLRTAMLWSHDHVRHVDHRKTQPIANSIRKGNACQRAASDHDRAFFGRLCARNTAAGTFPTLLPHSLEPQTKAASIKAHENTCTRKSRRNYIRVVLTIKCQTFLYFHLEWVCFSTVFFRLLVLVLLTGVRLRCCSTAYSDPYGTPFVDHHQKYTSLKDKHGD